MDPINDQNNWLAAPNQPIHNEDEIPQFEFPSLEQSPVVPPKPKVAGKKRKKPANKNFDFEEELKNIQEMDLSPKSKKKEINKLYCKNNRRKNKEYTKELEDKVEKLEQTIDKLAAQVEHYRYKISIMAMGGEKDFGDFKTIQMLSREELIKKMRTGEHKTHLDEKLKEMAKQGGSASNDRQKLLKTAFKVILDNIIPDRMRVLFNIVKEESPATYEDYEHLYKQNSKTFGLALQDPRYNEIDRFHYVTGVHPNLFYKMKSLNEKNRKYHFKFKNLIHDLVRLRNRILRLQYNWRKNDNPKESGLTPENIVKFLEYTGKLEMTPEHNVLNSWDIPKKPSAVKTEEYEGDSLFMSDSDDEIEQIKLLN